MASTPAFAATPRLGVALLSVANTNRDGSGTIETVLAAGSAGARLERIVIAARGTTTAGMVRLFVHNGTTAYLWREVPVGAATPSGSVQAFREELALEDMVLPNGHSLRAATHNAEGFNVIAFGGDF